MDAAIWTAIIAGCAAVIAASLPLLKKQSKGKKADDSPGRTKASVVGDGTAVAVDGSNNSVNVHAAKSDKSSQLEIVDVEIDERDEEFPAVDIKVRNLGDEPAFATKVCFSVTHCFVPKEYRQIRYSLQPVTWEYDLLLDGGCGDVVQSISQVIEARGTDRFTVRLAQEVSPPDLPMLVRFQLSLIYDDGKESKFREAVIALVPSVDEALGSYTAKSDEELRQWNLEEIRKFSKLSGNVSEWAKGQYEAVADA